jgi:hypothetical protein
MRLVLRVGVLYLIGCHAPLHRPEDQNVSGRTSGDRLPISLRVSRILQVSMGTGTFEPLSKSRLDNYYRHCFGQWHEENKPPVEVVLRARVHWMKRFLKETRFEPKGKYDAATGTLSVQLIATPDLKAWLQGLMPDLEVVAPTDLRAELKKRMQEALKLL